MDIWMRYYNEERTHQAKQSFGKTPMHAHMESKYLAEKKMLDAIVGQGE